MEPTPTVYDAPADVSRFQQRALIIGVIVLLLSAAVAFFAGYSKAHSDQVQSGLTQFFKSYLVAYVFCVGLTIGSLAIMMLHHMSGGAWGLVIRRIFEAATRTLPLLVILFIPLIAALFVHPHTPEGFSLYEWSDHAKVAADPILQHKSKYLNAPFFVGRAIFYFLVWGLLIYLFNKWSLEQDRTADRRLVDRMQSLSGPGLLLFGLTVTFAAVDWMMSLEPHWFSTIYGLLVMAGWGLSAFAFVITVAIILSRREPMSHVYQPSHFQDLGKLMLAFVMIYAYFAFSQFLIIWSANLREEIPWYLRRLHGGWQYVALALVVFHFALPFLLLLSRDLKRNSKALLRVAVMVLVARVVDLIFLIAPAFQHPGSQAHVEWLDLLTMFGVTVGLVGIWLAFFAWQLKRRPLMPIGAPELEQALEPAGHH
jgi:hypothetical protein